MNDSASPGPGQLIGGRYRLQRAVAESAEQGVLWLAGDTLAADAPMALRRLPSGRDPDAVQRLAARLQGVLHPQVPRFGAVIREASGLWLVRDWQAGNTYAQLLAARRERQLVFGAGEVLLLLRQLLPVLAALHGQDLIHGDLSPANLLRRDSDGLPVLLDFGLSRGWRSLDPEAPALVGATPGYAPPELVRGEPAAPWMDLHALAVVAMVLLSGDPPEALLDPVSLAWRRPVALERDPTLCRPIERLLEREPSRRFASAAEALAAFQAIPMPESTGPVPRADRTLVLVPQTVGDVPEPAAEAPLRPAASNAESDGGPPRPSGAADSSAAPSPEAPAAAGPDLPDFSPADHAPVAPPRPAARPRLQEKEEAVEGGVWPVLIALVLSAVVGTALGWWWLGRGQGSSTPQSGVELPASLPPSEVDRRQQLLNRLRALQIDRGWFLSLVDASLLAQYPERKGRLPGDSLEDAPLRKVWNELAEEWLARVEQIPMPLRSRLGGFRAADWERRQQSLRSQGLSSSVLSQLVSGSTRTLLPGRSADTIPPEPFRQLWYASAEMILETLRIDPIQLRPEITEVLAADVPASGARLFAVKLPAGHSLALGVNGTPLLQMAVFGADGTALSPRGPLRVVSLGRQEASPVQLLVSNEGVAPARISLSLRADPPPATAPAAEPGSTAAPPRETPLPGSVAAPDRPPAREAESSAPPAPSGEPGPATAPLPPVGPATPPPPVDP